MMRKEYSVLIWISGLILVGVVNFYAGRSYEREKILEKMEAPVEVAFPVLSPNQSPILMKQITIGSHSFVLAPVEENDPTTAGLRFGQLGNGWRLTAMIDRSNPVPLH